MIFIGAATDYYHSMSFT